MSYLNIFRLKVYKITSVLLLLFVVSFALQTVQDMLTSLHSFENISYNQQELKQSNFNINTITLSDDDQDKLHHHQISLVAPCILLLGFLFYPFKGLFETKNTKFVENLCLQKPSSGLFLSNRTLLI